MCIVQRRARSTEHGAAEHQQKNRNKRWRALPCVRCINVQENDCRIFQEFCLFSCELSNLFCTANSIERQHTPHRENITSRLLQTVHVILSRNISCEQRALHRTARLYRHLCEHVRMVCAPGGPTISRKLRAMLCAVAHPNEHTHSHTHSHRHTTHSI